MPRIGIASILLAAGWAAFVLVGQSWWQLAVAAFLAVVFAQIGFLAYDAGHQQIFTTRRGNDLVGILLANLAVGLGYGFWLPNHNRHHARPNQDGKDPDINFGSLAFTARRAGTACPIRISLPGVLSSSRCCRSPRSVCTWASRSIWPGGTGSGNGCCSPSMSPATSARSPGCCPRSRPRVFILVQQGLVGLFLRASFAPNHKGTPILNADNQTDFLRPQVLTSRNVRGGRLVGLALGGLNYQIEHHLFPSMPRPNLRHAQAIIRRFCHQHALTYCESNLTDSYAQTLRHLHSVGSNPSPATT